MISEIRYKQTSETGWYYLQSRYYDPIVKRFLIADSYGSTGQGFLGCNMFAYCQNNPINYSDPTGQRPWWEHNYGNGVVGYTDATSNGVATNGSNTSYGSFGNSVIAYTDTASNGVAASANNSGKPSTTYSNQSGTVSFGLTGSIGCGVIVTGSVGLAVDSFGNVALILSGGGGGGFPTLTAAGFVTGTNAPTVYQLGGASIQTGGSGGLLVSVGVEGTVIPDAVNGTTYYGGTLLIGGGAQFPVEWHGDVTDTAVIYLFNIFDLFRN